MENMGSKEELEKLLECVSLTVSSVKRGILKILGSNVNLEISEGEAMTLPETAIWIVIDYSQEGGGLESLGFMKEEVSRRVTEAYYLGNIYQILYRIYYQMNGYMFKFGRVRSISGTPEDVNSGDGVKVELEYFINIQEENAKFEIVNLTDEQMQEWTEERLKLNRYVKLLHTLLPELGVNLEDLGEQEEQVQEEKEQKIMNEAILQDIEKAAQALRKLKQSDDQFEDQLEDQQEVEQGQETDKNE